MGITKNKFKHLSVLRNKPFFWQGQETFPPLNDSVRSCLCGVSALSYRTIKTDLLWIKLFNLCSWRMEMNTVISQHELLVLLSNVSQKHPTLWNSKQNRIEHPLVCWRVLFLTVPARLAASSLKGLAYSNTHP